MENGSTNVINGEIIMKLITQVTCRQKHTSARSLDKSLKQQHTLKLVYMLFRTCVTQLHTSGVINKTQIHKLCVRTKGA